jgi:CRP-like cAMP-binding protein
MNEPHTDWHYHNKLLALLSDADYLGLMRYLKPQHVGHKEVLVSQGQPISHVDFPCTSVYSMTLAMSDGNTVEIGTIDNEGFTSLNARFEGHIATATVMCQIPGISLRMSLHDLQWEMENNPRFLYVLDLYCQAFLSQMEKSIACNKLHPLEQRVARWLLMTHDRIGQDVFPLTQEFLAAMLGAQRPTVSVIAKKFESAGALAYHRGRMHVVNRALLETLSCECYAASRREFERLLGVRAG